MADNFFGGLGSGGSGTNARGDFGTLPQNALPGLPRAVEPAVVQQQPMPLAGQAALAFNADIAAGPDFLDHAALVQPLAELLCHAHTQTPLTAALLGAAGTGKSFAVTRLLDQVSILSATAPGVSGTPFLSPVFIARLDAANLEGEAGTALGVAVCQALLKSAVLADQELAHQALETASDPHAAAALAQEKLGASQLQLDAESRSLAEARTRAAKLTDSVLNDPASSLDAYARSKRTMIDKRLRGFGFLRGDPIAHYRDLVRDLQESGGALPGTSAFLHAIWAFKGQTKLLVWAFLLVLAGFGFATLQATRTQWIDSLNGWGPNFVQVSTWLIQHESWLGPLKVGAFALAVLAVLRNLVRAWLFTRPLVKGLGLLRGDIDQKRSALEATMAQHSRRIAVLTEEIQRHERSAASAGQRAAAAGSAPGRLPVPALAGEVLPVQTPAQSFLANLDAVLQTAPRGAPRRIVVAVDNLDGVPPARAAEIMEAAARVFQGKQYALVLALDPKHLASAWGDSMARMEKLVQVPVQTGRNGLTAGQCSAMVLSLLGQTAPAAKPLAATVDASRSMLDRPMTVVEARLLQDLAPLAGRSARAVKRLVNLYRLARAPAPDRAGVAALMLALDIGGTPAEITALRNGLAATSADAAFNIADGGPRLAAALQSVRIAAGGVPTGAMMLAGLAAASPYMRK